MKFNKKMLWSVIGVVFGAVLSIIAFEALGFTVTNGGISYTVKLDQLANVMDTPDKTLYGLGVTGLVFGWLAIIFPVISLFTNKADKYLGWATLAFVAIALIMMIACQSYWTDKFADFIDKGYDAGSFILFMVGELTAFGTTIYAYKSNLKIERA